MTSLNRIVLVGDIDSQVESKETTEGTPLSRFVLQVDRPQRADGTDSGSDQVNIVSFREIAQSAQDLSQGQSVLVEGKIITRNFEREDGTRKYVTEVEANQIIGLGQSETTETKKINKEEKQNTDVGEKQTVVKEEKADISFDFEEEKSDIQLPDFSKSLEEDVPF